MLGFAPSTDNERVSRSREHIEDEKITAFTQRQPEAKEEGSDQKWHSCRSSQSDKMEGTHQKDSDQEAEEDARIEKSEELGSNDLSQQESEKN